MFFFLDETRTPHRVTGRNQTYSNVPDLPKADPNSTSRHIRSVTPVDLTCFAMPEAHTHKTIRNVLAALI